MALTAKQRRAIARAPKAQRARMLASYRSTPAQSSRPAPRARHQITSGRSVPRRGFNAFALDKPALAFSVGRATLVRGMARRTFGIKADPVMAGQTHMMVIISAHAGHFIGQIVAVNANTGIVTAQHEISMESAGFSASGPSSSSPDAALTARQSVRVRNISPALEVAGQCYALNMAAGVLLDTAPTYSSLVRYVEGHPRTVTFSASDLRSGRQWDAHPVDQGKYHQFSLPNTDINGFKSTLADPGMSTIVLVFPVIGNAEALSEQQYELTVQGNYYTRYRVTGPLAHAAEHPPTMALPVLNAARDVAEALGSMGRQAIGDIASGFGQAAFQSLTNRQRLPAIADVAPLLVD